MTKDSFIEVISNLSPQEINQLIQDKGKEPKKIKIWKHVQQQSNTKGKEK